MLSRQQKEYLDAMGIGIWSLREPPVVVADSVGETSNAEPAGTPVDVPVEAPVDIAVETPAGIPGLKLGPGRGGILLVCARDSDSASRLANDISRALGSVPVWAWPDTEPGAVQLSDAVEENLFTTVAIFGDGLAQQFFSGDIPANLHAANLVQLPAIRDISAQAEARQTLWAALCRAGMVTSV